MDLLTSGDIERIDTSRLIDVVPIAAMVSEGTIAIEFIAVEIRSAGGVILLRVIDDEASPDAMDFAVPRVVVRTEAGQATKATAVANDFVSLRSVRHRFVFPSTPLGTTARCEVDGFDFRDESPGSVWKAPWVSLTARSK